MRDNVPGGLPQTGVIICGSTNVDTFVHVADFPRPGETVLATPGVQGLGGKGANQAVACAQFGVPAVFI
ncbi:PfkB family carbohydrate kinase, partial [Corynebacterium heidelbergense]